MATRAEAECYDLKPLLSELRRERNEARKDCDQIRSARESERAEHTAEAAVSKVQFQKAAFLLRGACAGRDHALRRLEDLRKAAPPTQVDIDEALEQARAADEARVAAEAERDQTTAGRDKARQGYLAAKQQRETLAAKLVRDVAEARQQGYTRGRASRAGEIDAAGDRDRKLQVELDALRRRHSAAVQVARTKGVAAGRAERDDQIAALQQTVERLTTERDDQVTTLQQTVERLTTQLNAVNQDCQRLDRRVRNVTEHCDDLKQRLKEP